MFHGKKEVPFNSQRTSKSSYLKIFVTVQAVEKGGVLGCRGAGGDIRSRENGLTKVQVKYTRSNLLLLILDPGKMGDTRELQKFRKNTPGLSILWF